MGGEFLEEPETPAPRITRVNGLHLPFDPLQILSWVIIILLVVSFCAALMPMLASPLAEILLLTYVMALVGVLVSGFETGRRDPIDPHVLVPDEELEEIDDLLKCSACCSRVNKLSRHCLICDKCVVDYDHHCRWLNNCIGEVNYRPFLVLIVTAMLLVGIQLLAAAILLIEYIGNMDKLSIDLEASSINMNQDVYLGILFCNGIIGCPAFLMVTHLVGFHIYLGYYGLTTYNYVMQVQAEEKRVNAYIEDSDSDSDTDVSTDEEPSPPANAKVEPATEDVVVTKTGTATDDVKVTKDCIEEAEGKIPGQIDDMTLCTEKPVANGKDEHPPRRGPIQLAPLSPVSGLSTDNKPTK